MSWKATCIGMHHGLIPLLLKNLWLILHSRMCFEVCFDLKMSSCVLFVGNRFSHKHMQVEVCVFCIVYNIACRQVHVTRGPASRQFV